MGCDNEKRYEWKGFACVFLCVNGLRVFFQLPVYVIASDPETGLIDLPGFGEMVVNSFIGAFVLAIAYQVLHLLQKDMTGDCA